MIARKNFNPELYLVLDPTIASKHPIEKVLAEAIAGGVSLVQVREKNCSNEAFLALVAKVAPILKSLAVPLIINDRVDVALAVGAEGVHLGQSDMHWSEARKLLGSDAIIGLSVESRAQALAANNADIDYLGVSSVFPTTTKADIKKVWGLNGVKELRQLSNLPLVGIGGISTHNAHSVIEAGAHGIAVVSGICSKPNVRQSALELRHAIRNLTTRSLP